MKTDFEFEKSYHFDSIESLRYDIKEQEKKARKAQHLSQTDLSERAGISLGSLRRFEQTGEISLTSLLRIGNVLGCLSDFHVLFASGKYTSIEQVIKENE
jgi:transcriptional regulator with XRE-family HTH domain